MTRSNAREIAVQMIFSLGFGNLSADEVLDTQLTQERFQELEIPNAAAINEAVEIAKSYESQDVVAFINGILGSFVRAEFADTPPKPEKAARADDKAED